MFELNLMKKYLSVLLAFVFVLSFAQVSFAQVASTSTTSVDSSNCTVLNPCNTIVQNNQCPTSWMSHPFSDSYTRDVSGDGYPRQNVCDYSGQATQSECDAEGALSTGGPHGLWCQKFINNDSVLLSLVRIPGQVVTQTPPPLPPVVVATSGISISQSFLSNFSSSGLPAGVTSSQINQIISEAQKNPAVTSIINQLAASTTALSRLSSVIRPNVSTVVSTPSVVSNTSGTQIDLPDAGSNQCANLTRSFGYGTRDYGTSTDVSVLQDFLNSNGYLATNPTGFFGRATLAAVKAFQTSQGISPTGYIGAYTRAAIARVDCGTTATPAVTPIATPVSLPVVVSTSTATTTTQ